MNADTILAIFSVIALTLIGWGAGVIFLLWLSAKPKSPAPVHSLVWDTYTSVNPTPRDGYEPFAVTELTGYSTQYHFRRATPNVPVDEPALPYD